MRYSCLVAMTASSKQPPLWASLRALAGWPAGRWAVAVLGAAGTAVVIGIPTGLVHTAYFTRMTAALWWNFPVWIAGSVLAGLTLATYYRPGGDLAVRGAGLTGGGLLTAFAVGCPSCNSLVVAALGASGALTIWAPLQPLVAVVALAILFYAMLRRLRAGQGCTVPAVAPTTTGTSTYPYE